MVDILDTVIGSGIVVINLFPFLLKQQKYVFLTALVSLLILFLLVFFKG